MALLERLHALAKSVPPKEVEGCRVLWLLHGEGEDARVGIALLVLLVFRQKKPYRLVLLHIVPVGGLSVREWAFSQAAGTLRFEHSEEDDMDSLHFALDTHLCAVIADSHTAAAYARICATRVLFRPVSVDTVEVFGASKSCSSMVGRCIVGLQHCNLAATAFRFRVIS